MDQDNRKDPRVVLQRCDKGCSNDNQYQNMARQHRSGAKNCLQKRPMRFLTTKLKSGDRKEDPLRKTKASQLENKFQKFFPINVSWEQVLIHV